MQFSNLLTDWYLQHRRDLPWRHTSDPYLIWLSEIILQQTRVAQGTPYFFAFAAAFPTVTDLAKADEEQVMRLWQGLGYYSRARNLHATAKFVVDQCDAVFPNTYERLIKLPGVGPYTAAAIASFAFGEDVPVVDGNVFRVLSRVFDIAEDIASPAARRTFTEHAAKLLPPGNGQMFNQAIMEFGALQCVPKNPSCSVCVMSADCLAYARGKVSELPLKSKKAKPRDRHFNYIFLSDEQRRTLVRRRAGKDIWQGLYEFPLVETNSRMDREAAILEAGRYAEVISVAEPVSVLHKLTHQNLHIAFWRATVRGEIEGGTSIDELGKYAMPQALVNFCRSEYGR